MAFALRVLRAGLALISALIVPIYGVSFVLFPTRMLAKAPARPVLAEGEVWALETEQGTVEAFFFPAGPRAPALVFCHGNAELIDYQRARAGWYRQHGFSVLLPEYRGYGRFQGTPSQAALVTDFVAFYDPSLSRVSGAVAPSPNYQSTSSSRLR